MPNSKSRDIPVNIEQFKTICWLLWEGSAQSVENARRMLIDILETEKETIKPATTVGITICVNTDDAITKLKTLNNQILNITDNLKKLNNVKIPQQESIYGPGSSEGFTADAHTPSTP